ncbi:MAG: Tryptophan synthase alpha chain [Chlamydiae bacterium]|nr:Tryptophan synthase alpha chain [Chlamydiota bacterium]
MSRIATAFEKKDVFIGYLTVGDKSTTFTQKAALALERGGVDVLELGLPFSDPIGDGPVIQAAITRALANHTTPLDVLQVIREIRKKSSIPIVIMSYYNPLLKLGENFLSKAKRAGVDGLLVVDLPIDEAGNYLKTMRSLKLDTVFLITPNTSELRKMQIAQLSTGFIYYACQKGTTGMRSNLPKDLLKKVREIKSMTSKPVAVGFGVKSKNDAKEILKEAHGFVVGSAFMDLIAKKGTLKQLEELARKIKP